MNREFEHGGNVYHVLRKNAVDFEQLLDFSANINPLGLSPTVRKTLTDSIDRVVHYPDPQATQLKTAIASFYGVPYASITAGNGAVELLYILSYTLKPRRVLIPAPTFSEYERASRAAGATIDYLYLDAQSDFQLDTKLLIKMAGYADIVYICNPNNPTGAILTNSDLEPVIAACCVSDTVVVVDESFIDFLPDDSCFTCRQLLSRYANLVIVHSLTKFYAIPGLRLGFVLTNPSLQSRLNASKDPWNVNSLAQSAGVAGLQDRQYRAESQKFVTTAKQSLYHGLKSIGGIKPFQPAVNYVFANIAGLGLNAAELKKQLEARHLLIRDCSNYQGLSQYFIRLAVKLPEQNDIVLNAISNTTR